MAPLIRRVRLIFTGSEHSASTSTALDREALTREFHFRERKGRPEVILADEVAQELGHPATASRALVLVTFEPDIVHHGRITLLGPDLDAMLGGSQERHPFAQVVILAARPDRLPDPFALESAQFLMNRLPGYMVRSVPGKLWVRLSRKAYTAGLTLRTVGSALIAVYTGDFESIEGVEVLFITSSREDVEALDPLAAEATILSGRHKKLVLGLDGEAECKDLNCATCEEKPVCDNLRDVIIKRRNVRRP